MTDSEAAGGENFELERVRKLAELMVEFDLREVELSRDEFAIRLCRGAGSGNAPSAPQPVSAAPVATPVAAAATAPMQPSNIAVIKSPMVGTFYSRPNPKAPAFVKVGDYVQPEKTICIIEAMKVFNEIPAEVGGRVVAILAEDEQAVEFGSPLFKIDTSVESS